MMEFNEERNRKYRAMQPDSEADYLEAEIRHIRAWDESNLEW